MAVLEGDSTDMPAAAPGFGVSEAASEDVRLMRHLGQRVRDLRKLKGMPRRELAAISGVSQRYLAKLEGGDGNISITVLGKVSRALGMPVEAMVSSGAADSSTLVQLMSLFLQADGATRGRVFQVLDPEYVKEQKAQRICLVGLRGAGKSTLGTLVAKAWDVPFVELNKTIEAEAGMPLGDIIAMYGQEGYRRLEADVLDKIIAANDRAVVAVAGGIVADQTTYQNVLARFHTVWLKTTSGEHMDRVRAQGDKRPMEGNPRAMIQLREILRAREEYYAQADHHLSTSGKSVAESEADLSKIIRAHALLAQR